MGFFGQCHRHRQRVAMGFGCFFNNFFLLLFFIVCFRRYFSQMREASCQWPLHKDSSIRRVDTYIFWISIHCSEITNKREKSERSKNLKLFVNYSFWPTDSEFEENNGNIFRKWSVNCNSLMANGHTLNICIVNVDYRLEMGNELNNLL